MGTTSPPLLANCFLFSHKPAYSPSIYSPHPPTPTQLQQAEYKEQYVYTTDLTWEGGAGGGILYTLHDASHVMARPWSPCNPLLYISRRCQGLHISNPPSPSCICMYIILYIWQLASCNPFDLFFTTRIFSLSRLHILSTFKSAFCSLWPVLTVLSRENEQGSTGLPVALNDWFLMMNLNGLWAISYLQRAPYGIGNHIFWLRPLKFVFAG